MYNITCTSASLSQEGDAVIAQGAGGLVSAAHSDMPGKLSAEPRAAE